MENKLNKQTINHGDLIRLEGWSSCALEVADIGTYSIIGSLVDIKKGKVIRPLWVVSIDEKWMVVKTAQDFIESMKIFSPQGILER
jgi:hypothetical protein